MLVESIPTVSFNGDRAVVIPRKFTSRIRRRVPSTKYRDKAVISYGIRIPTSVLTSTWCNTGPSRSSRTMRADEIIRGILLGMFAS
jgi:hypothetical protein